jgi:hypothetical protein
MSLAAEDVADALDAIREEGAPVNFVTVESVPINPDKPWLGTTDTPTEATVHMAFIDQATAAAMVNEWSGDAELPASTRYGMLGNNGFEPSVGQVIKRPGKEDLVVRKVMIAAPADVPVFFVLEMSA